MNASTISRLIPEVILDKSEHLEITSEIPFTVDTSKSMTAEDGDDYGDPDTIITWITLRFYKGARRVLKQDVQIMLSPAEYELVTTDTAQSRPCMVIMSWTRNGLMLVSIKLADDIQWHNVYNS